MHPRVERQLTERSRMAQHAFISHPRARPPGTPRFGQTGPVESTGDEPVTPNPATGNPSPEPTPGAASEPRRGRRTDTFMDRLSRQRREDPGRC